MRVLVDLEPVGPVSVVRELPDYRVSLLEGYNGIGKSLTVRLLQVLTGTLPYEVRSPDWKSMCAALGAGGVSISKLHGEVRIDWSFDTRTWPSGGSTVQDDWFEELLIDGNPATLSEVRAHLRVHRLAGDETLVDSLALMVENRRGQVQQLLSDLTAPDGRLFAAETRLDQAVTLLERVQPSRLINDRQVVASLADDVTTLGREHERSAALLALLQQAVEIRNDLQTLQQRAPELDGRVAELDRQVAATQTQRAAVDKQLRVQTQRAAVSGKVSHDLQNARATRDRNRQKLTHALDRLSAATAAVDIETDEKAVRDAITSIKRELAALERRQEEADLAPAMRGVLDALTSPLVAAITRGYGDQELLELRGITVTISQLAEAASGRRQQLEGLPPAPEALALKKDVAHLRQRFSKLEEIPTLIADRDRFERLYAQSEERVQALLSTGALEAAQLVQDLERQRTSVDRELLDLAAERAAVVQRRVSIGGGATEQQLRVDLERHLVQMETTAQELDKRLAKEATHEQQVRARLAATREQLTTVRQDVSRQEAELLELLEQLRDPQLAWLTGDEVVPSLDGATQWLSDAQACLGSAQDRLGAVRNQIQGVATSLGAIASELRGREPSGTVYENPLRTWLSEEFSDWFDEPLVRQHLFPDATDVRLDLATRQVTWQTSTRTESRPLSAFSSGEQAFAYTQARLARLDTESQPGVNQLVVLDEFGSFIAENRLTALYQLLRERISTRPLDQVVIVLPLREDYGELAESALGAQRDEYAALAQALDRHSYVVRDLTP